MAHSNVKESYVNRTSQLSEPKAGAEPGINPLHTSTLQSHGQFKEDCVIEVADYSSDYVSIQRLRNEELIDLLKEPPAVDDQGVSDSSDSKRACVRWINIGGLDWDVICAVGLKYNLHALALEDTLHEQGHNQSKADYYNEHLFIRILCHTLEPPGDGDGLSHENPEPPSEFPALGSSESALERGQLPSEKDPDTRSKEHVEKHPAPAGPRSHELKRRFTSLTGFAGPARQREMLKIKALTRGDRVNVRHEPMSIFLTRNGTVISIHPNPTLHLTSPVTERLAHPESVLRTSEDASLLVESILDLIVDRVLEIMDEYQDKIHKLEHDVLLKPGMSTVRSLHILSGDLIMHKRTLDPIKTMIYGLRRYDVDRCTALADDLEEEAEREESRSRHRREDKKPGTLDRDRSKRKKRVRGYFSYKAKVYLADVNDHIDFVLTSLDMFAGISENLINFGFNMASYEMNQVMRRLTLATIIFLPLTLLTGYFGMNFMDFSATDGSELLFWKISLPVMAALIPIFMLTDLQRLWRYMKKFIEARNSVKGYQAT